MNAKDEMLKPCPFCGGEPTIATMFREGEEKDVFYVYCPNSKKLNCQVCPTTRYWNADTKEEAIKAWNTRPTASEAKPAPMTKPNDERLLRINLMIKEKLADFQIDMLEEIENTYSDLNEKLRKAIQ